VNWRNRYVAMRLGLLRQRQAQEQSEQRRRVAAASLYRGYQGVDTSAFFSGFPPAISAIPQTQRPGFYRSGQFEEDG
jgi:hypothetical protein